LIICESLGCACASFVVANAVSQIYFFLEIQVSQRSEKAVYHTKFSNKNLTVPFSQRLKVISRLLFNGIRDVLTGGHFVAAVEIAIISNAKVLTHKDGN
jgi:hypothetical protein